MKVEFLAAAEREFRDASRYYEVRVPGLGHEFIASSSEVIRCWLSAMPCDLDAIDGIGA